MSALWFAALFVCGFVGGYGIARGNAAKRRRKEGRR